MLEPVAARKKTAVLDKQAWRPGGGRPHNPVIGSSACIDAALHRLRCLAKPGPSQHVNPMLPAPLQGAGHL